MDRKINLLITGGAGFIGSNLVEHFLKDERIGLVRVLDNLSNGYIENIQEFFGDPRFEFIEGDIRDYETCLKACEGIDKISHQAALGSVPRSIENPIQSAEVNILGTVNLMYAAVQQNIERVILAFSSSTYGDRPDLPKVEDKIGNPLSPYAVTKAAIEQFAEVFGKTYGLKWVGLRYFNVFGPRQNAKNPYAAVIPLFIDLISQRQSITINGSDKISRDFTYVTNVIESNEASLFTNNPTALNQIYNVATGKAVTLKEVYETIGEIFLPQGNSVNVKVASKRPGDIEHSLADNSKIKKKLEVKLNVSFRQGIIYLKQKNN